MGDENFFSRKIPRGVGWLYTLGSLSLFLLSLQLITGILLAMNFSASPEQAHASIQYIMEQVPMGRLIRGLHKWGASLMVIFVTLHMIRVYFMGAYKYPRERTWVLGVFLWIVVLMFGFTGYLLPWDQKAYWATTVGTHLAAQVPWIGPSIAKVLQGGKTLGAVTLTRFYAFHILVLPLFLFSLTGIHLFFVIQQGISAPPDREKIPQDSHWKERVKNRYLELKSQGQSFFPYTIYKDILAVFAVFLLAFALALWSPAGLEEVADPTDSNYNPRPEWYFLFLFQALKFFPGSLEALAAVLLPSLALGLLVLLPFLDKGPQRHWWDRPWVTGLGVTALAGVIALSVMGWRSPRVNPVVKEDPQVVSGRALYSELRCYYCHSIRGKGGVTAPDLSTVGARRDRVWLLKHFEDPAALSPGTVMPKLHLLPEEMSRLAAYLETLGGGGPYSPKAPGLFQKNCSSCHALDSRGESLGPDL
ncbi:MAG: cytochrome b N-terminal domain-containing protein, partial [Deltaproteobacteria bacterium]|nr:cytochrome b N-terminal domain-containing protein [Deltaproteobacteria bacterium]